MSHISYDDPDGYYHHKPAPPPAPKGSFLVMRDPLPTPDGQPESEVVALFVSREAEVRAIDYAAACNRGKLLWIPGGRYEEPLVMPEVETKRVH